MGSAAAVASAGSGYQSSPPAWMPSANVKAVQTMLGHKSAALTLDTYADLFPDDLEAVADALDAAVRASRKTTADGLRTEDGPAS